MQIYRNYLEIKSIKDLKEIKKPSDNYFIELVDPKDFQLNKFFYKQVGKNHQWIDRLSWADQNWIDYVADSKLSTYILKEPIENDNLIASLSKYPPNFFPK